MMLTTGMLISGSTSTGVVNSTNGVANTIMMAITMTVYGRLSATLTIHMKRAWGIPGEEWEGEISAYARSVAPTPAWRQNGRNVSKVNVRLDVQTYAASKQQKNRPTITVDRLSISSTRDF